MTRTCPNCNSVLGPDAPEGACPVCALTNALEPGQEESAPPAGVTLSWPAGLAPGRILHYFGDYELREEIARGGMGLVFLARQMSLNRMVALKMILRGQLATESEVKRFQAEAEAAARLQHPNIVAIHEVGVHEGQHYFSMDFVAGKDLAAMVREHSLPAPVAARYVKIIAEAIHYAHQQGVLHRDLKPSNVLIDENDQPRITDFGLAKQLASDSDVTRSGQVLGSPSFMPPEQAAGHKAQVGPQSDIYSLGAILYHLLTGRPPFVAATVEATLAQVLGAEPVPPHTLTSTVPRDLETICLKCLEKEPAQRYPTAQELALDLGRFLKGEPVRARPVPRREKVWRWCRRNPALAGSLAAAATLLVALAIGSTLGAMRIARARDAERNQRLRAVAREAESRERMARLKVAEGWHLVEQGGWFEALAPFLDALTLERGNLERENAHRARIAYLLQCGPQLRRMWFPGGPLTRVELSPDGRRVLTAMVSSGERTNAAAAQVWDLLTGEPVTPRMRHADRINFACFSPDGSRVATASEDRTARVWDAATGQPLSPPLRHARGVAHAAFSRDGNRLATCSPPDWYSETNGYAMVWDALTGAAEYTNQIYGMNAQLVMFANDDRWLMVGSISYLCNFFDLRTGERVAAVPDCWVTYAAAYSPDASRLLIAGSFGVYGGFGARIFDAHTMEARTPLLRQSGGLPLVAAFSPDGHTVASAVGDRVARLWDAHTGQPRGSPLLHAGPVVGAVFSPDGRLVVTASRDGTARVWDSETGLPANPPLQHGGPLCNAWFTKNGSEVVTGSEDGAVRVWALSPKVPAQRIILAKGQVRCARFSPDGRRIATGDSGGVVEIWHASNLQPAAPPMNHSSSLVFAKFSLAGRRFLTLCEDTLLRVWDLSAAPSKLLWMCGTQRPDITSDGKRVVVAYLEKVGMIRDGETGKPLTPDLRDLLPRGTIEICRKARFSPDDNWVGFADDSGKVGLWEVATLRPGPHFKAHAARLNDLWFSPDSRVFVTVSDDNTARLWDTRSGVPLSEPLGHVGPVRAAAFSPDGGRVLTGSDDGTARLWTCPGGRPIGQVLAHGGAIHDVCFSADGRRVATASADSTARVWAPDTGEPLTPPLAHAGQVHTVEFSPDGHFLLTASDDQTARLWTLPSGQGQLDALVSQALLLCPGPAFTNQARLQQQWASFGTTVAGKPGEAPPQERQPEDRGTPAQLALLLAARKQAGDQRDLRNTERVLTRLLEIATNQWTWLFGRGYARSRLGNYKGAVEDYSRAVSVAPQASVCWLGRYLARSALGDPGAPADLRAMLERRRSFSGIATEEIAVADPSLAEQWGALDDDCTADLRAGPETARLYCGRAAAEGADGRFRLARTDFKRALELQPAQAEPWLALALIYRYLGSRASHYWQDAADAAQHVLEITPGDAQAQSLRAEALQHLQKPPKPD